MERANFLSWFKKLFLPAVQHLSGDPGVILFVDGHHSHLSLELIQVAKVKCVHLVCFPPHMTHILQPLDVSVYHPVKHYWTKVLKDFKLESMGENVSKSVFPSLIRKLWEGSFKPSHIVSAFCAAGLHPLDRAVVLGKITASVPFHEPSAGSSSSTAPSTSSSLSQSASSSSTTTLALQATGTIIKGKCTNCGVALTPMLHFEKLLQKKNAEKGTQKKRKRVKSNYYREAMTSNEAIERLQAEQAERDKQPKKRQKVTLSDTKSSEVEEASHDEGFNLFSHLYKLKVLSMFLYGLQKLGLSAKNVGKQKTVILSSGSVVTLAGDGSTTLVLVSNESLAQDPCLNVLLVRIFIHSSLRKYLNTTF